MSISRSNPNQVTSEEKLVNFIKTNQKAIDAIKSTFEMNNTTGSMGRMLDEIYQSDYFDLNEFREHFKLAFKENIADASAGFISAFETYFKALHNDLFERDGRLKASILAAMSIASKMDKTSFDGFYERKINQIHESIWNAILIGIQSQFRSVFENESTQETRMIALLSGMLPDLKTRVDHVSFLSLSIMLKGAIEKINNLKKSIEGMTKVPDNRKDQYHLFSAIIKSHELRANAIQRLIKLPLRKIENSKDSVSKLVLSATVARSAYNRIPVINKKIEQFLSDLPNDANVLVESLANADLVGGYPFNLDCIAQEECIIRNSNALFLAPETYPQGGLAAMGHVYSTDGNQVYVWDDKKLKTIKSSGPSFTLAYAASPNLTSSEVQAKVLAQNKFDSYDSIMARNTRLLFEHAKLAGKNTILMGAPGCGAFGNNPLRAAAIRRCVIDEMKLKPSYQDINVQFVIYHPEQSKSHHLVELFDYVMNDLTSDNIKLIMKYCNPSNSVSFLPSGQLKSKSEIKYYLDKLSELSEFDKLINTLKSTLKVEDKSILIPLLGGKKPIDRWSKLITGAKTDLNSTHMSKTYAILMLNNAIAEIRYQLLNNYNLNQAKDALSNSIQTAVTNITAKGQVTDRLTKFIDDHIKDNHSIKKNIK